VIIKIKNELRKTWEICPTAITCPIAIYYHRHNYCENMVNDYRSKSCVIVKGDDVRTTGSSVCRNTCKHLLLDIYEKQKAFNRLSTAWTQPQGYDFHKGRPSGINHSLHTSQCILVRERLPTTVSVFHRGF
jgi:hypothetical protein